MFISALNYYGLNKIVYLTTHHQLRCEGPASLEGGPQHEKVVVVQEVLVLTPSVGHSRSAPCFCPFCQQEKFKRSWSPCQWEARAAEVGPFSGCRDCDQSDQRTMEAREKVVELFEELLPFQSTTLEQGLTRARALDHNEREW